MKLPPFKALNPEETRIGAFLGLLFVFKVGWWAILLSLACAYLWSAGGAKKEDGGNKAYRRIGCSLLPTITVFTICQQGFVDGTGVLHLWPLISFPLAWAVLSIGYGIKSTQPPDPGSWLGNFWLRKMESTGASPSDCEKFANVYTRSLIYSLLFASFLPIFIAK